MNTFKEALGRLDNLTPLGHSSAGIVVEVGRDVQKFAVCCEYVVKYKYVR